MNPLSEFFESGQTILWVETQNTVAFLRPVPDIRVWTPCPTACLAESLRLRQVRLAALQLLSQLLLLGHIHSGAEKPFKNPVVEDRNTNAPHVTDLAVGPYDPLGEVEPATIAQHLLDLLCDELPIL